MQPMIAESSDTRHAGYAAAGDEKAMVARSVGFRNPNRRLEFVGAGNLNRFFENV